MKERIFYQGSRTYYNASKFFPKDLREKVTTLYAFVRSVDDLVDANPPQVKEFEKWDEEWRLAWSGKKVKNEIIRDFVRLAKQNSFEKKWVEGFFASMRFDAEKKTCESLEQSIWYMYGSAEVIGLMMARLMDLPEAALESAALLGRAMQYINYIRDIDEDNKLGKKYLMGRTNPVTEEEKKQFSMFIQQEIERYYAWNTKAKQGYKYIPYRARIAIMTADDMYKWTAKQIEKNPLLVFERKVKPTTTRILLDGIKNVVKALWI